jgi:tetratricopeptide (TPR) repeat protein
LWRLTNRAAQGISECERALALNRNLADAHGAIGIAKIFIGRSQETEAHIQEAFRLSPRDDSIYRWMHYVGVAKLLLNSEADALVWLRRCLEANRNYPIAHFHLAAALARLGSLNEARSAVQTGLALDPTFTIQRMRGIILSDNPIFRAGSRRIREGMRMAGVPEG